LKALGISLLCLLILSGCDLVKKKENETLSENYGKPLARVYNKYLYYKDISGIQEGHHSKEDSIALVQRYIDVWVQKQLMLLKAEAQVDPDEEEIKNKILECRNTLLIHEYEKLYLKQTLDTNVSEKDVRDYYEANVDNFQLKQNIIKGVFIKISKEAPKKDKLKTLINSSKPKDIKELKSYCVRFASNYILEDTIWINFDELIKNTPFMNVSDRVSFLERNRYSEIADNQYIYFLKISDYKISKQISPLDFVADQIKTILLNKRRITLINELKENIYNEAKKDKEFEIYNVK
jgi:hypothetical protein